MYLDVIEEKSTRKKIEQTILKLEVKRAKLLHSADAEIRKQIYIQFVLDF